MHTGFEPRTFKWDSNTLTPGLRYPAPPVESSVLLLLFLSWPQIDRGTGNRTSNLPGTAPTWPGLFFWATVYSGILGSLHQLQAASSDHTRVAAGVEEAQCFSPPERETFTVKALRSATSVIKLSSQYIAYSWRVALQLCLCRPALPHMSQLSTVGTVVSHLNKWLLTA